MQALPTQFEDHAIRRVYDEDTETWSFSVVDIIQVLTQQPDHQVARKYWKVLKGRLAAEGSKVVTNCYQLKMTATDGKQRLTDVATAQTLLRLVQSVPSPKAEPTGDRLSPVHKLGAVRLTRNTGLEAVRKRNRLREACPSGRGSPEGNSKAWLAMKSR
jgi:hypothetical protein